MSLASTGTCTYVHIPRKTSHMHRIKNKIVFKLVKSKDKTDVGCLSGLVGVIKRLAFK